MAKNSFLSSKTLHHCIFSLLIVDAFKHWNLLIIFYTCAFKIFCQYWLYFHFSSSVYSPNPWRSWEAAVQLSPRRPLQGGWPSHHPVRSHGRWALVIENCGWITLGMFQASRLRAFSGTETTPSLTRPTSPTRRARCRTPWPSRGWTGATWARGTDAWPPTPTWAWPRRPGSPWTSCVSSDRPLIWSRPGTQPRGSDGMRCWKVFCVASLCLAQVAW